MRVNIDDIEKILGFKLKSKIIERFASLNLNFNNLSQEEFNEYLIDVINVITNDIVSSGAHRINEWEVGWGENYKIFFNTKNILDLIPKYHSKRNYVRWQGNIINPEDKRFDYWIHTVFVDSIISHYLEDCKNIFEFGCGPAYHLLRLTSLMPEKGFWGADWTKASQNIIQEINNNLNTSITGINFDFFNPNYNFEFPKNCGIYTVAALEQVGENFKPFIDYLLKKRPNICVHLEPIDELLNSKKLTDFLSIKYFRKRNYLKGFLPYLEDLESKGIIEIIKKQRIYSGSYFIEGHSLVVWKPK